MVSNGISAWETAPGIDIYMVSIECVIERYLNALLNGIEYVVVLNGIEYAMEAT